MVTSDFLAGAAGILLSLILSFTPGLAPWLAAKDPVWKRLTVLAAVALVAAGAFGLSCAGVTGLPFQIACSASGAVGLAQTVIVCLVASQAAYAITPPLPEPATPSSVAVSTHTDGDLRNLPAMDQAPAPKGP